MRKATIAKDIVDFQLLNEESENGTTNKDALTRNRKLNPKYVKIIGPVILVVLLVIIISLVGLPGSKNEGKDQPSLTDWTSERLKHVTIGNNSTEAPNLKFENVSTGYWTRRTTTNITPTMRSFTSLGTTDYDPFTDVPNTSISLPKYPKASLNILTNDWYIIMSNLDGWVLDNSHSNFEKGSRLTTWGYLHGHNQHFRFTNFQNATKFNLVNRNSGMYVSRGHTAETSSQVIQWDTDFSSYELWMFQETAEEGVVQIRDGHGIQCLYNTGNHEISSNRLFVADCTLEPNSQWRVLRFCQD